MKKILSKALIGAVACGLVLGACGCDKNKTFYSNENDPLTFTTQDVDKVSIRFSILPVPTAISSV